MDFSLLIVWFSIAISMFFLGLIQGQRSGYERGRKLWQEIGLYKQAIWKRMYIDLWNRVYPDYPTKIYLTKEELEAIDKMEKLSNA